MWEISYNDKVTLTVDSSDPLILCAVIHDFTLTDLVSRLRELKQLKMVIYHNYMESVIILN